MYFTAGDNTLEYFTFEAKSPTDRLPVVLIHGLLGGNVEEDWVTPGTLDALTAGYPVIALNCRAHGGSCAPHDPDAYGQEMVQDVICLLDHRGIPKAHIVGWSMGATIGANVAVCHPDRVGRAVLLACGAMSRSQWQTNTNGLPEVVRRCVAFLETGAGDFPVFKYVGRTDQPPLLPETTAELAREALTGRDPLAFAALLRAWDRLTIEDELLPAATVPTLAVIGSLDGSTRHTPDLQAVWPALRVTVIDGGDHWFTDRTAEMLGATVAFLREYDV